MSYQSISSSQSVLRIIRTSLVMFLFLLLGGGMASHAQTGNATVKGKVTDASGESLIGVTVMVKGTSVGTSTDLDGNYELSVSGRSAVLRFSYIGYVSKEETVGNRSVVDVQLLEDNNVLNEVVVVGYDTQRKANLTGAVGTVDVAKQLEGRPLPDLGRGLQGSVPGLTVTSSSGRIGSTPVIKIRGQIGTIIDGGSSNPLILLDGVEISDLSLVNPDDVAEISVLKDAASSSIYGTRAAFGVVLITTKKGSSKDKYTVNYSNNFSWAKPTVLPQMAKSYEGAGMALEMRRRSSPGAVSYQSTNMLIWNDESIDRMKEWERVYGGLNLSPEMVYGRDFETLSGTTYFYRSFDAADLYMKEYSASQQHNLSVSGSTGKTNIYLGIGYMGQGGVVKVKPDEFDRYSVNLNVDTRVNDRITARGKFLFSRTNLETPFNFNSVTYDALYYLYRWPSIMPYGTYQGKPFHNSITEVAAANYDMDTKDYIRASVGATIDIIKGLSLDLDYTFNKDDQMIIQRGGEVGGWDFWSTGQIVETKNWAAAGRNKVDQYFYHRDYHAGNAVLRYKKDIRLHKISAFAGTNIEQKEVRMLNGWKLGLLDFSKPEIDLATGNNTTYDAAGYPTFNQGEFLDGSHTSWAILGFFGRINYSFADRYLVELNGRYDGSSKFPVNQQFAFFPSGSLGWVFTGESFMEPLQPVVSFGKLRASYGSVGNQAVGDNRFRALLASGVNSGWVISGNEKTFGMPAAISPNFTWETIESKNLGLDLRFFNDKLGLSADLFQRKNKNMIASGEEVPAFFGASAPMTNIGELTTNGWEIGVDFRHTFANGLKLGLTANVSDALATITQHRNGLGTAIDGSNYKGKIYGEIWGFETDRFFTEADFAHDADGNHIVVDGVTQMAPGVASQARIESAYGWFNYQPGDVKYKDLSKDGKIDWGDNTPENPGDMKRIGNTTPRYEYNSRLSLEWKGVDFELFIQGVGKRDYWATGTMIIPGWNNAEATFYEHQTDYWTTDNTNAFYPRLTPYSQPTQYTRAAALNFMPQTKYLLDMSYFRIKNITLGYTLPAQLLQKAKIERLRVYASLENVAEFDHLGNLPLDPETGTSSGDGGNMGFGRIYPFTRLASFGVQLKF
ncbi:MAG: TonB-dependent receptor [Dysgonamonadaceae bacterium]|jgi:TonB-linked SusC/RagA family outer membrane protein|nr:TonB-dependent receptor [Dysgonamonadaceae bacterium]